MVLSRRVVATRGVLLVMKILEDERYVVIKAYKCEIWRDYFNISTYCVYVVSLHTEFTDSMIISHDGSHDSLERIQDTRHNGTNMVIKSSWQYSHKGGE